METLVIKFSQTINNDGLKIKADFELEIPHERLVKELENRGYEASEENIQKLKDAMTEEIVSVDEDSLENLFMSNSDSCHNRDRGLDIFWWVLDESGVFEVNDDEE